jgi:hypothetical protein
VSVVAQGDAAHALADAAVAGDPAAFDNAAAQFTGTSLGTAIDGAQVGDVDGAIGNEATDTSDPGSTTLDPVESPPLDTTIIDPGSTTLDPVESPPLDTTIIDPGSTTLDPVESPPLDATIIDLGSTTLDPVESSPLDATIIDLGGTTIDPVELPPLDTATIETPIREQVIQDPADGMLHPAV